MIFAASPGDSSKVGGGPAAEVPMTGTVSPASAAPANTYPSIADTSACGRSMVAATGAATTRPKA